MSDLAQIETTAVTKRRSLPRALFHVTTLHAWQAMQRGDVLKAGHGYGWEERQGVFALSWNNWVATKSLHYLSFLTIKLRGRRDSLVILRIEMTPELVDKTQVALLSSGTATSRLLLEKAKAGRFRSVTPEQVALLNTYEDTLVRNTFALREFVRETPSAPDPVEYIIECDVPMQYVTKVAEVTRPDIPSNILKSGQRLARKMQHLQGRAPRGKRPKSLVTAEDKKAFIARLLKSRRLHLIARTRQR